jgi:ElaB/YqjD/DUF883 family membrane-anchored ribosome-binding protein
MDQAKAQEQSKDNRKPASDAGFDLNTLRSDLSDLKETVAKLVSRASNEATNSAREIAGEVGTTAKDLAERGANAATDHAKTLLAELENVGRRNPLGALAGAVVIGILIGMMERRR